MCSINIKIKLKIRKIYSTVKIYCKKIKKSFSFFNLLYTDVQQLQYSIPVFQIIVLISICSIDYFSQESGPREEDQKEKKEKTRQDGRDKSEISAVYFIGNIKH